MESFTAIKIITFLYILFNSGRVFSYIPQIIAVFKEKTPVLAISLVTWSFWTAANLTTALYATVVLPDQLLAAMSYGNTLGCAVVVFLVIYKRYKYNYWPKSKRNQTFETSPVTAFTEVPNLDAEEIYHFFDVSDDSNENHTVTFSKKFKHDSIETFESFLDMTKEATQNFASENNENLIVQVDESPAEELPKDTTEKINELPLNTVSTPKKRTRKKKETVLIQVETHVNEVKQEIEAPVASPTEVSTVVNPQLPTVTNKRIRNPRKKK